MKHRNIQSLHISLLLKMINSTCLANFCSNTVERICTGVTGEKLHLLVQHSWEFIIHSICRRIRSHSPIILHKPHLNILQIRERNPSWIKAVQHSSTLQLHTTHRWTQYFIIPLHRIKLKLNRHTQYIKLNYLSYSTNLIVLYLYTHAQNLKHL